MASISPFDLGRYCSLLTSKFLYIALSWQKDEVNPFSAGQLAFANSVDLDQMASISPSDLGLHCSLHISKLCM